MRLHIAPGRLLRWPAGWPDQEDGVLFDAASGDYWVLEPAARALVQAVQATPGLALEALQARAHALADHSGAHPGVPAGTELDEQVAALAAAGVLRTEAETGAQAQAPEPPR